MLDNDRVLSGLMGVAVGDALGVPVEFTSREERTQNPVTTMQGNGTWNQLPGTWSDDSSLTFCLAECMCQEKLSLDEIAKSFYRWYSESYWSARGETFDIGNTTFLAIVDWKQGKSPVDAGGRSEKSNGNGSLMRILPLAYLYQNLEYGDLMELTEKISSITHAHLRSRMACGIYISIAIELLGGASIELAYHRGIENYLNWCGTPVGDEINGEGRQISNYNAEKHHFDRILDGRIGSLPVEEIRSGGYVIDTLEACLWCLLETSSYSEAVLKAADRKSVV